jgi:hypothetical protein
VPEDTGGSEHDAAYLPFPDERLLSALSSLGRVIIDDEDFFLVKVGTIKSVQGD